MTKTMSEKDAEKMGFTARGVGLDLKANTFGENTKLGKAWEKGWKRRDKKKRGMGT